jgi:cation diffusion facilitator CzcD-associated flavoprotein CzcO
MATGALSAPSVPDFPGLNSFGGRWFRTAAWPQEPVDFTGRRVAVIGTGSSGVQIVPEIAACAAHLYVMQRTAGFVVPSVNRPPDGHRDAPGQGRVPRLPGPGPRDVPRRVLPASGAVSPRGDRGGAHGHL